jgi:two-component system nitrogen regulation response regulator NtrX
MASILIVDDEPNILSSLAGALSREHHAVETAADLGTARRRLAEAFDVVLLDVRLPDGSGIDLLAEIARTAPATVVIMMSGHANVDTAVQATRLGAWDFLEKPVSLERLLVLLRNATGARALEDENRRLKASWSAAIVGTSPAIRRVLGEIERAGAANARVLIEGENGTGKELVARALHEASPRGRMPFIAVNCSAIPEELIESELFGHERGAFTGATQARRGRFEEAHGGTLFLDEVADLSPRAQTKLLRVLQEGELTRVGGSRAQRVDVRVIAASNRDLAAAVKTGTFREDLYFRLAVIPITVPPLRERRGDIPALVAAFVASLGVPGAPRGFDQGALEALAHHAWPGNVRELRNVVERLLIMGRGPVIGAAQVRAALPADAAAPPDPDAKLADAVRGFERQVIERALAAEDGHMTRAAQRLGLERSHLYKKMKKLGLEP